MMRPHGEHVASHGTA
jgi:iron(III) transport system ATP-binding protein